jgi:MULE transposase domain
MSLKQIKIARRFVSRFIYKTNATFNTNCLNLLLSVIVSINNTSKTFLIAYCYITSELAMSFKWILEQLTNLAFYNCLKAALICKDFSKGLRAAVAAKATSDLTRTLPTDVVLPQDPFAILKATKVIVGKAAKRPVLVKL